MHFFFAVVYKRIFEISGQENNNDDWNFILDQNLVNEWNLQISETYRFLKFEILNSIAWLQSRLNLCFYRHFQWNMREISYICGSLFRF